ncbi:hypothetical protein [Parachlamydia acanthamoebae]|jgi:hypothetical protein|uniref:hypothetical protein n=1 Tax=Parachlamydia acanthamoebae TaxID=83552 RepID=UPI0024E26D1D|nr:hypothetical protein [Parachlamydia acanthamoebae]
MSKINFFTPIIYNSPHTFKSYFLKKADNYFHLGGKKAYVIGQTKNKQEKVILCESKVSLFDKIGKVASYFTVITPLFMLGTKAVLRSKHHFKIIDPRRKLEKNIDISQDTVSKIEKLLPKILGKKDDDAIDWLSTGNNLVFKLKEVPNLVFKVNPTRTSRNRFANMIKAKRVCLAHRLDHLVVPHAKQFIVKPSLSSPRMYAFIAEENLHVNPTTSEQQELHRTHAIKLKETWKQLAKFIALTEFNDVKPVNIPLVPEKKGFEDPSRIALVDLEHMESAVDGFCGSYNKSNGLLSCIPAEQIKDIVKEANKHGITLSKKLVRAIEKDRLQEIEHHKKVREFHEKKGI